MFKCKILLMCALLAFGITVLPAGAQVSVNIEIGTPPPSERVEIVPPPRPGYVWAPGYWRWDGREHVWVAGRWIEERSGYVWVPERWEPKGHRYHFVPGHWVRADARKDWKKMDKEREKELKKEAKEREKEWKKQEKEREREWKKENEWK